jgi:hypothetical protein
MYYDIIKMMKNKKFPQYRVIDGEIYIKIDQDPKTLAITAINHLGNPYEPIKALFDGRPTDQEAFNRAFNS